ncbi:MAG: hypothetical protein IJP60_02485 [Bacilli bacterium]|nr:hypothetical protein [Bacilli bacterium]
MTRVEKYREYRNEISQLPSEPNQTKKRQSSQRVDELLKENKNQKKLAFEDVYEGLDIYNVEHTNIERTHPNYRKRNLILFYSLMTLVIIGLIIGIILVGTSLYGGK